MMMLDAFFVVYRLNVAPFTYTAQLYTIAPAGLTAQTMVFTNEDIESLRSRMPPELRRIVVTGVAVPAGNTLVEVWI